MYDQEIQQCPDRRGGFFRSSRVGLAAVMLATGFWTPGCSSPLDQKAEDDLRSSLLEAHREFLESVAGAGVVELSREPSDVEENLSDERRAELDAMSGMTAYSDIPVDPGQDLRGETEDPIVELSLDRAIAMAVANNLDLETARLTPAITERQLVQAEAVFDATLFGSVDWQNLDTPGAPTGLIPGFSGDRQAETLALNTGVRKQLTTGGQASIQTTFQRTEEDPSAQGVSPFYEANALVTLQQPLLRNFGRDVNTANISLARNAEQSAIESLRGSTINLVDQVEEGYWSLLVARQQLLIQEKLLERTVEERDRLQDRLEFDVSPVRFTEANSFVELRRADVIRAREQWRVASDQLKRLINAPELPLADEDLILPVDRPVDEALTFSLLDAVTTALQHRPELRTAGLAIKDTYIRQRVADNARLPLLDLTASVRVNAFDVDSGGGAYDSVSEADYIDYLLRLDFEYPLGNRSAEALFDQRRLERRQALLDYRRQAQDTVLEVKNALRSVITQYELIGAARAARRAAADNLRAIQAQEDAGVALTPEFLLDLKLSAQQRLADAETQEVQALADYMISISEVYRVMGTLLDRAGISVVVPTYLE